MPAFLFHLVFASAAKQSIINDRTGLLRPASSCFVTAFLAVLAVLAKTMALLVEDD